MSRVLRQYDVHGMRLRLEAPDEALAEAAGHVLRPFAVADGAEGEFVLCVEYGAPGSDGDVAGMELSWRGIGAGGLAGAFYHGEDAWLMRMDGLAEARVDVAERSARVCVVPGQEACLYTCCIVPVLCELLHQVGQHVVHAASLAAGAPGDRRAVLLAGESGAGKTTAALALAQSGMYLLADDASFVGPGADGATVVWGLPRPCKVHRRTLKLLPWLAELPHASAPTEDEVLIESACLPGGERQVEARPGVILLLESRNDRDHRLTPVDRWRR